VISVRERVESTSLWDIGRLVSVVWYRASLRMLLYPQSSITLNSLKLSMLCYWYSSTCALFPFQSSIAFRSEQLHDDRLRQDIDVVHERHDAAGCLDPEVCSLHAINRPMRIQRSICFTASIALEPASRWSGKGIAYLSGQARCCGQLTNNDQW
jgi:hypothetical protein